MAQYESFAQVYDLLMDDFDYDAWCEHYLKLIARKGVVLRSLCDCACGTGSLAIRFAQTVNVVTGLDLSLEMLEIAAAKARRAGKRINFVQQDMRRLALHRPVDALVCGCDGVNYLTDPDAVQSFFAAAFQGLVPGGALAFDISTPYKLLEQIGDNFFAEEREDVAYIWQNFSERDCAKVTMDISFFVRQQADVYRRFGETHVQRAHTPEEITTWLQSAGFVDVDAFGEWRMDAPKDKDSRIHFVATRP